jgi:hypothetical protein
MNNLTQNGLKCYLWGDLLLLQGLCYLHWSPWLKQCLVSSGEINQSSVSKPNCLLCEIRCVVWYRTDFDVLTKQPLTALMRVTFLSFLSLPLNGFFSCKSKIYSLILPPFYRCVCPVSPSYFGNALPGFTKYGVNITSLQPLAKLVGKGGLQGRQMAHKYFFCLSIYFFPYWVEEGQKRSRNIFLDFYLGGVKTRKCKTLAGTNVGRLYNLTAS